MCVNFHTGPYNSRPFLPPSPGRYFAVATRKDMKTPLSDIEVQFQVMHPKGKEWTQMHAPVLLTVAKLSDALNYAVDDAMTITWAVDEQNYSLTWLMLVVRDDCLLKLCPWHLEKVETYARMNAEPFEVRIIFFWGKLCIVLSIFC